MASLKNIDHVVLVLSGKGGVGKSSVTTQLALTLARKGHSVGVLDIDLTGPSLPRMFGLEGQQVHQSSAGWVPVYIPLGDTAGHGQLCVMSIGFMLKDRADSVVWRGPKKTAMVRQFVRDVVWGKLDFLLIDTPPGTSDEHISIAEQLREAALTGGAHVDGAVLVTTPQAVATADVRKELSFARKVGFNVLGVIENMSGYVCPHCAECSNIFSTGGGERLAEQYGLEFLGRVPIEQQFVLMIEQQQTDVASRVAANAAAGRDELVVPRALVDQYGESALCPIFAAITDKILARIAADRAAVPEPDE
ncbi:Cfd1p [Dipodascopsis tothii]|uniref:Cfd1p n=1 Tax=Dipodascopsis tothii TaxID=44089 RepID=UPI0034CD8A44